MSDEHRVDETLRALDLAPGGDGRERLGALLRSLAHDLNSPLGSLTMDIYSLGESLREVSEALEGEPAAIRRELAELDDIRSNLDAAARHAVRVVRELRRLGNGLQGEG